MSKRTTNLVIYGSPLVLESDANKSHDHCFGNAAAHERKNWRRGTETAILSPPFLLRGVRGELGVILSGKKIFSYFTVTIRPEEGPVFIFIIIIGLLGEAISFAEELLSLFKKRDTVF